MTDPVLRVEALTAGYDGPPVIRDVSLTVGPGEVVAVLGANGAGKSTTLRAISGLLPAATGTVTLAGRPLTKIPAAARARLGIAHVPEGRGVFAGLTVAEHLRLGHRGERLDTALAYQYFPALAELRDRRAGLLSGGEQQMVTLGRALARTPKVLLVDELSLGLAPLVVSRLLTAVREAADRGAAVVLVEQHVDRAMRVADHVLVLERGRVVLSGPTADVAGRVKDIEASYLAVGGNDTPGCEQTAATTRTE